MINLPLYHLYNNETQIALLDNSSIAFMEQLHKKGYTPESILRSYDAIFVPGWVIEEAECSPYRSQYLNDLHTSGFPLYRINEQDYIALTDGNEVQMFHIVSASVSKLAALIQYI